MDVLQGAPHPNAARLLVEFVWSPDGQKVFADNGYLPADPNVPARGLEFKPDGGHFEVTYITPELARDDLPKWTAIYKELFR